MSGPAARPIEARFWPKVDTNGPGGCWLWTAGTSGGYGVLGVGGHRGGKVRAHRLAYELLRGPIPAGLVIDHLCRRPACVNPDHMEPVTQRVNILRGESAGARAARTGRCAAGHPRTPTNVHIAKDGHAICRPCHADRERERYRRRAAERKASE